MALYERTGVGRLTDDLETAKARIRAKVEHPLRVVKQQWGHNKVRYCDLTKNTAQFVTLAALANLWAVRRKLMVSPLGKSAQIPLRRSKTGSTGMKGAPPWPLPIAMPALTSRHDWQLADIWLFRPSLAVMLAFQKLSSVKSRPTSFRAASSNVRVVGVN